MKRIVLINILILLSIAGCAPPTINGPTLSMGEINTERYVAIGSDYTAGLSDYGVFEEGQRYSFPNLLAGQFQKIKMNAFNQAYIPKGLDSYWKINTPDSLMNWDCKGNSVFSFLEESPASSSPFPPAYPGDYHNLGVPCIGLADVTKKQIECPYLKRFSDTTISYLDLISIKKPSFFTLEMGFDDVWKYGTLGKESISPLEFETNYRKLIQTLNTTTSKGVLLTIPYLTETPYFIASTAFFKDNKTCEPIPYYLMTDKGEVRLSGSNDYVSLYYIIRYLKKYPQIGRSPSNPVPQYMVLDSAEYHALYERTTEYNNIIFNLGKEYKLPVCDLRKMVSTLRSKEIIEDGIHFSEEYIFGGFYTLDGYSFTPRGNAMLTNELIEIINQYYKAQIPYLNIMDFPAQSYLQ